MLDGERVSASYLTWEVGDADWNKGFGRLRIGTPNKGEIRIDYPIKNIEIDFKAFTIKSDNTSLGTQFYDGDELITNKLTPYYLKWNVYGTNRINELELHMC